MTERLNPHDDISQRIARLKLDLSSEIVIREEEGHWDYPQYDDYDRKVRWIISKPRITQLDVEKREQAKTSLIDIYNSAQSLRIQMQAGKALGYSRIRILRERLFS